MGATGVEEELTAVESGATELLEEALAPVEIGATGVLDLPVWMVTKPVLKQLLVEPAAPDDTGALPVG